MLSIPVSNIKTHLTVLEKIGNLGSFREAGFLRASWSNEESAAMAYVRDVGAEHGLRTKYDGVGNLYLSTPGSGDQVVQVGSHVDTVPFGGNYDGAAGILAGLEAILAVRKSWPIFSKRLELVIWRGEESATFGSVCKGSRAAFGVNDRNILLRKFDGRTLEQAIIGQGFDPSFIAECRPALEQAHIDSIAAYFELHIEQARRLEIERKEIGITTSIRGTIRTRFVVTGEAAHSGGTPMGVDYRRDANLAIATMQVEMEKLGQQRLAEGADLVQTVGVLNSDRDYNVQNPAVHENAITKVSPYGYFTTDVRSNNVSFLEAHMAEIETLFGQIAERFNVLLSVQRLMFLDPIAEMDPTLQGVLVEACQESSASHIKMPSGALHDAAVVAIHPRGDGTFIPTALLFIPCRDGISHNAREYATPDAIRIGAEVLAVALQSMAS